ncbi:AGAP001862-PA [Anopheles gambiae str. PEST]|uniref:AGAP001862-PA n=2 Tax=gambiae species complex TaxID=44542 RepID=Q7PYB7_ANOGA|nr:FMRFamide receptor-like [Anopheles coluzzii]XP_049461867.1 FMRFamide receptor-like [Anopheles coluzzii]XP_049461868.1 FMRFamide receptor-like [Anopheles coluzzii]XP_049461869.1 FMRFamide receptor-like [Anopheles coluzzii]EAA01756.2 AGAP001862-PA [Anopheles gambiae str. PEST]
MNASSLDYEVRHLLLGNGSSSSGGGVGLGSGIGGTGPSSPGEESALVGNLTARMVGATNESVLTVVSCYDDYLPNELLVEFEFWISGVVMNIVALIGILGNIFSMVILSRPQMRSSINYLLIGLARCDTVLILTSVLIFGLCAIYPHTGYLYYYHYQIFPKISLVVYPLAMIAQTASVYLTLTVTLERYVAVCHPLRARALCTYGRARLYVVGILVFSILYNLPRFWEVTLISSTHPDTGLTIYCVKASDMRTNETYIKVYIHWLYMIFVYFLPFSLISFFNLMIYRQVRRANKERQRLSRSEKREIGLATMLICVVIVFLLCNLPAMMINIVEAFYSVIIEYMVKVSNLLVTINSSVNFFIYVIFGEKFKRIFLLLFCKPRGRQSPDDGLIHDDSSFSNGDASNRNSGRFQRVGTTRSTSTKLSNCSMRTIRTTVRSTRAPSPGPIVYYPARETLPRLAQPPTITRSSSMFPDWSARENGTHGGIMMASSGF